MKKICMFCIGDLYSKQSGGTKRFLELFHHLISRGYEVDLYSNTAQESLEKNGIKGYSLNTTYEKKSILNIPSYIIYVNNKEIYNEIKKKKYDYVISFDVPSTIGLVLKKIPNIIFCVRQDLLKYRKIQYESRKMKIIKKYLLLSVGWIMEGICLFGSKKIIIQCKYDLNELLKRHWILKRSISKKSKIQINNVNPFWTIKNIFMLQDKKEKHYDLIYVGNFDDKRKGAELFLETVDLLYKKGRILKVILLGNGDLLEENKKKYRDNTNINFKGYVENPIQYLQKSKLVVVPSYADSCPNTIMEALMAQVPVIGANVSGIPEILNKEEWLFELDAIKIAEKIDEIFQNDKLEIIEKEQKIRKKELEFNWGREIEKLIFN